MHVITHALTGWIAADALLSTRRDRALVTAAAVAPDLDGAGVVVELATRHTPMPLLWWSEYHHVLAHNLLAAVVIAAAVAALARRRLASAVLAFAMVHLHFVMDILGSRGPDGYDWPVPYLYPFSDTLQLFWTGQWALNAWPNIAFTILLIGLTLYLAWRRGHSVLGLLSPTADVAVVATLRHRFGKPGDLA